MPTQSQIELATWLALAVRAKVPMAAVEVSYPRDGCRVQFSHAERRVVVEAYPQHGFYVAVVPPGRPWPLSDELDEAYCGEKSNDGEKAVFAAIDALQQQPAIGLTGQFPAGKLREDDRGELRLAVLLAKDGSVVLDFGCSVTWIGMEPHQARELAAVLIAKADESDRTRGSG